MERLAQLLDGVEAAQPEQVLLERADEALDAAVALGLAHERGRACDAEEGELVLEVLDDLLLLRKMLERERELLARISHSQWLVSACPRQRAGWRRAAQQAPQTDCFSPKYGKLRKSAASRLFWKNV